MPAQTSGNPMVLMLIIFLIFFFVVLRPEMTKQKEKKKQLANLKKFDKVITAGGIHGTVVLVKETTVVVRIDDNVKIELDKEGIASVSQETKKS